MITSLLFALALQGTCDPAMVAFVRVQTDSVRKTHTSPATQRGVTLYQRRALSRIDSTMQRRCLTAPVPVDTVPTPPPPPPTGNQSPVANWTHACTLRPDGFGNDCIVDATSSTDADGSIASYAWTVPNRTPQSGAAASFPFPQGSVQTITLIVTDNGGAADTLVRTITIQGTPGTPGPVIPPPVTPPPPPPPVTPPPVTPPPSGSVMSTAPELPRATVDVTWPTPSRTYAIAASGNLQTALDTARRGDEVVLPAGASYTGNFIVPAKPGSCTTTSGWITLRTSALAQLPPLGSRIQAGDSVHMPKIVTPTVVVPLTFANGATCWRFVGIEIMPGPNVSVGPTSARQQGLMYIGDAQQSQPPDRVTLDRMYIHGLANTNVHRCVALNARNVAIIGSRLVECHGKGFDSQAIGSWNGFGPYLIDNNRLESPGEVILFGGANAPNTAKDITIRRNYLGAPMSWKGVWTMKNTFELKCAERVLFEDNILENTWVDGQVGFAVVIGAADPQAAACTIQDVLMRWNHIHNVAGGVNVFMRYGTTNGGTRRIKIEQLLGTNIGAAGLGLNGRAWQLRENVDDLWVERTTMLGPVHGLILERATLPAKRNFTFRFNIFGGGTYAWFSSAGQGDANVANELVPGTYVVTPNCVVGSAVVPTGITRSATIAGCTGGVDQAQLQARLQGVR